MACEFSNVNNSCGCLIGYLLPLLTVDDEEITSYPVEVLNVDEEFIGTANNPTEYAFIWNSDSANQAYGILYVGSGAYCFYLKKINDTVPPSSVLGAPRDEDFYIITEINQIFESEDEVDLFIQE